MRDFIVRCFIRGVVAVAGVAGVAGGVAPVGAQTPVQQLQSAASRGPMFYAVTSSRTERIDARNAAVLRQSIGVHLRDATLPAALAAIGGLAGLRFVYDDALLPKDARVSLQADEISVAAALTQVLLDAGVDVELAPTGLVSIVRRAPSTKPARQIGTIAGRVTDATTGQGLASVTVAVDGTQRAAVTNDSGGYRIANVPDGNHTVTARRIGYARSSQSIVITADQEYTVNFALEQVANSLDQVVITGTAGNQERRAQPAVVATINAAEVTRTAPINNVLELLTARVPGVGLTAANGAVGGTSLIRIRGPASISLSNEPLVFIDGIRINSGNVDGLGTTSSVLNDLDPNNIESVEVVKGPAAATLYGADASAGVIQIITKKGRLGEAFTQRVSLEANQLRPNWTPPSNFEPCSAANVLPASTSTLCRGQAVGTVVSDNPLLRNDVLRNGNGSVLSWQGSGGGQTYNYFLSYGRNQLDGVIPNNRTARQSVRINFGVLPVSTLRIDANFGLSHDVVHQTPQDGNALGFLNGLIGHPTTVGGVTDGWAFGAYTNRAIVNESDRNISDRILPSVTATYTPLPWFTNRLTLGADVSYINQRLLFPKNDSSWYGLFGFDDGFVSEARIDQKVYTVDYLGNVRRTLGTSGHWAADLSFGTQLISNQSNVVGGSGIGLLTNEANALSATASGPGRTSTGSRSTQRFLGYLGQLQLGYRDRLFLQYGARVDRNSAFGDASRSFFLPKYGVSYVVSEESFWKQHLPLLNTMRLRAAYGTTGRAPTPGAALTTFSASTYIDPVTGIPTNGVVPLNPGNSDLRAERGTEFEGGFDAGLWNDRVGVEVTYYNKVSNNLLLQRQIPLSLGFTDNPFVNLGSVLNRGLELALHANIVSTRNVRLDGRFTMSTLHNEVTSLGGVPGFTYGRVFRLAEGRPLSAIFIQRVTGVDVANDRAIVTDTAVYVGSANPKREGAFGGDLTLFRSLRVTALFDFKSGHRKFNTGDWYREKQDPLSQRVNNQSTLPADERLRLFGPYVNSTGAAVSPSAVFEDYIDDASFVRFRELNATLSLPARFASTLRARDVSITAGARNLKLWTENLSTDPEAISNVPTDGLFNAGVFLSLPQPQRFFLRLDLGF